MLGSGLSPNIVELRGAEVRAWYLNGRIEAGISLDH